MPDNSRGSDEVVSSLLLWWEGHLIRQVRIISGTLSIVGSAPDTFPSRGRLLERPPLLRNNLFIRA